MTFRRVGRADEVPEGRGHCVRVGELEVGLFRVEGRIYAMENRCPHADAPLHEGELRGAVVTCPGHGWEFDVRTGWNPDHPDGWPIPCFEVQVKDGEVWVDTERPRNLGRR
jgi:nitrite reductase/ring-hydroxylating ferredoxin subunit